MKLHQKICLQLFLLFCWKQPQQHEVSAGRKFLQSGLTLSDANLMFEILLGGVEIDRDSNIVLHDEELASMHSGRAFLSHINDGIPKTLSTMAQTIWTMEEERRSLTPAQFHSVVLSMVYSALQARPRRGAEGQAWQEEEQQAWGEVLLQLANITVYQLRGHPFTIYGKKIK